MAAAGGQSPIRLARLAGAFYLLVILVGAPGPLVLGRIIVAGDAAATAANLLASRPAVWLAFAVYLLSIAAYVVVTGLLFVLLRPVDRTVALVAALFSLVGCAAMAAGALFLDSALLVLGGPHPAALGAPASNDLALLFTQLYIEGFNLSIVFFGCYCLIIGWLVYNSGFLPRLLGIAMAAGGIFYLSFLSPPVAHALFPWNVLPGFIGEAGLTLWLLLAGVDPQRWLAAAGRHR